MAAELGGVETVEENWPAAALRVADLTSKDGRARRFVAPPAEEELVPQPVDEHVAQRLGSAAQDAESRWIGRCELGPQVLAALVHDAFAANDDDVLLQL